MGPRGNIEELTSKRAAVVGLAYGRRRPHVAECSLDELTGLAGATVVHRAVQERPRPDPAIFLGRGNAETIFSASDDEPPRRLIDQCADRGVRIAKRNVWRGCAAMVAVVLAVGCVTRVPVVTAPAYPDYLYPTVPDELTSSTEARHHEEAWTVFQAGDLVGAEKRYVALLQDSPGFYPADAGLGWLMLARGDSREAAEHFDRAVSGEASYLPALLGRGESMLALEETAEALRSFESALEVDPGLSDIARVVEQLRFSVVSEQLQMARTHADAGQFEDARDAYVRVIAASPDSAFLHVELGRVELRQENLDEALDHARQAADLDPSDPAAFLLEGELHAETGDLQAAVVAFERADRLDPNDDVTRRLDDLRNRIRMAGLPPEILAIPSKTSVTRGELAALIGERFNEFLDEASRRRTVIITDTRDYWGHQWIQDVTQAGVMRVDAGYRFEPERAVRRSDLAEVADAMLDLFAEVDPSTASRWIDKRPNFSDMRAGHLSYTSAARAVAAGVLAVLEDETFQPARAVDGGEAVRAVDRLAELARELQ